jgi:D-amino-acid oxidase
MPVVIGCGIIGLTSALRLLESGQPVTLLARDLPPQTTSDVAAAVWYVYAVQPLAHAVRWAAATLATYRTLANDPTSGVSWTTVHELHPEPPASHWWAGLVEGERLPALPHGFAEGYALRIPLIEPNIHLPWLLARVQALGGRIEQRALARLDEAFGIESIVVNCSGIGARTLANDAEVYPIRGQVLRVHAPGVTHGVLEESDPVHPGYIFPRSSDCILGGLARANDWDTQPDDALTADILRRCTALEPALAAAPVLGVKVGLRPGRSAVRLEREQQGETTVIHNYGHGGAGFTLAYGCAADVTTLAT